MKKILKREFFERPVLEVAPGLLGKYLVREIDGEKRAFMITDVEAYDGEKDLACHASKGRTKRTEVMYGPAGVWYVYLIYGMYDILNIITGEEEYPAGIMFRGLEGVSGPGRLTRELSITRKLNCFPASSKNGLWIEDRGEDVSSKYIQTLPRVGVEYAGIWAKKPYRFVLDM